MSISEKNGVKFERPRLRAGTWLLAVIIAAEGFLSFLLYLTVASRVFESTPSRAAAGVPQLMSYQGRLTDTSGNPLGGTGTIYCFRYSIYDATSTGSRVWPTSAPSTATTTVQDGVFSDQIGRVDALTYDFISTSTLYLNVEVNTATTTCSGSWETLSPRQQITAAGFALTSESIYGSALRTPTSTKVQIGTGGGVTSGQTMLSLDVKTAADTIGSACTDNGSLWYNSANTRALICEAGVIQEISNADVISGIQADTTTTLISTGSVVLSGFHAITISQTGNTLQFSALDPQSLQPQTWEPYQAINTQTVVLGNGTIFLWGATVPPNVTVTATQVKFYASISMSTNAASSHAGVISMDFGIYTRNSNTLNSATTGTTAYQWSVTGNQISTGAVSNVSNFSVLSGLRAIPINVNINMTPGEYWFGFWSRTSTTNQNWFTASNVYISAMSNALLGNISSNSNSSAQFRLGWGMYSNASTNTLLQSFNISDIKGGVAGANRIPYVYFANTSF